MNRNPTVSPGPGRNPGCLRFAILTSLWLAASMVPGRAQEKTSQPVDVRSIVRHLNMIYTMPYYNSREDWLARRDSLRSQILVAAGLVPTPKKAPLNVQSFGRLERSGYTIEKISFESHPGFYVTGNLYRPSGKSGPFPAVLSPHGHWAYGRLQDSELCSVPVRCINLALQGYVVFAYDMVGYNDSRQVDHRTSGERAALWGFSSLGLHLWNSIRAADFLESLPEVDKTRLACTGASGGGTQTFLLTAVDDRIGTSAPVNMISSIMQGGDVCENAPNLRVDTNNMEIAALMAPRPMIMVSATGDWTKNTLEVEFPSIRKIYRLLGAEEKITAVQVEAPHNYNQESREHVYRWFGKWILGPSTPELLAEKKVRVADLGDMLLYYGRSLPPGLKDEKQIVEEFIAGAQAAVDDARPHDRETWQRYREKFETALRYSLMAGFPQASSVEFFASQPISKPAFRVIRFYLTRQRRGDRIPATLWLPGGKTDPRQGALLIHPEGAQRFEQAGAPGKTVEALLEKGCSVLIPDVFNTGRAALQRSQGEKYFTTYNRTDDANRVQDVLTSLAFLRKQLESKPIKVLGYGKGGLWCLLARGLADDEASFAVDADRFDAASDEAYLATLNIPGIRRAGDFKTAAILNLRGPVWIHSAAPGFPASWISQVFQSLGKADLLKIDAQEAGDAALLRWLIQDPAGTK